MDVNPLEPTRPAVHPERPSTVRYLGFHNTDIGRAYSLRVDSAGTPRTITVTIPHAAFGAKKARFQDAPELCFAKLQRAIAEHAELPDGLELVIGLEELDEYRDAQSRRDTRAQEAQPPAGPLNAVAGVTAQQDPPEQDVVVDSRPHGRSLLLVGLASRLLRELPPPLLLLVLRGPRGRRDPPAEEALGAAAVGRQRGARHDRAVPAHTRHAAVDRGAGGARARHSAHGDARPVAGERAGLDALPGCSSTSTSSRSNRRTSASRWTS